MHALTAACSVQNLPSLTATQTLTFNQNQTDPSTRPHWGWLHLLEDLALNVLQAVDGRLLSDHVLHARLLGLRRRPHASQLRGLLCSRDASSTASMIAGDAYILTSSSLASYTQHIQG